MPTYQLRITVDGMQTIMIINAKSEKDARKKFEKYSREMKFTSAVIHRIKEIE